MMQKTHAAAWLVAGIFLAANAAAGQFVYPAKGQSPEQQKMDETECAAWAIQQSGYDPAKPATVQAAPPPPQQTGPSGSRVRGAVVGAAVGAATGGDAGDAALAGAVVGGSAERAGKRKAASAQQQAAQQQQQAVAEKNAAGQANYDKAVGACLEGRGYSVK